MTFCVSLLCILYVLRHIECTATHPIYDPDNLFTVSAPELKRLKRRYEKLDVDKNGRISAEEFMYVLEHAGHYTSTAHLTGTTNTF